MKKLIIALAVILIATVTTTVMAGDKKADQKSYYQHTPSQTLQPATIWSPIITERKDGTVYKSYYQLPDSKVTPKGSIWNPLISVPEKKKGK